MLVESEWNVGFIRGRKLLPFIGLKIKSKWEQELVYRNQQVEWFVCHSAIEVSYSLVAVLVRTSWSFARRFSQGAPWQDRDLQNV